MSIRNTLCMVSMLALGTGVAAQAHPDVDDAREAFERGDFLAALNKLQRAEQSPSLTEDELVDLYWYRGAASQVLRRAAETNKAFDALLELRPLHQPDEGEASPDLLKAYQARVDAYAKRCPGAIKNPRLEGRDVLFTLETSPCRQVERVVVFARPQGARAFTPHETLAPSGTVRVTVRDNALWDSLKGGGTLEVVVEARNVRGIPQLRAGDAVKPLQMAVTAGGGPAPTPVPAPVPAQPRPRPNPTPEVAQPAPAPAPTPENPEPAPANPGRSMVRPAAIGLAIGGGVAFVLGLLPLFPLALAGATFLVVDNQLKQPGAQVKSNWQTLRTVWQAGAASTVGLGVLAGLGAVVAALGVAAALGGVALFFVGDGL